MRRAFRLMLSAAAIIRPLRFFSIHLGLSHCIQIFLDLLSRFIWATGDWPVMLHSFIYQLLLNWVQGAGTVVAVCLKMINKSWFCDKSPKNFDLRFFSHQDWILRCIALLNLSWHLCCGHKVVREKEKANCNDGDYQCEQKHPLHPNTISVLFTSLHVFFLSLSLCGNGRSRKFVNFSGDSRYNYCIAIALKTVEQRVKR